MGRIVATEYVSVDGVIEAPSGPSDFARAGWTDAYTRGPDGDAYMHAQGMEAAALLMGRLTYEPFAAAWPLFDGEFADRMNAMPKYVVSSTLTDPQWNNTTVVGGDAVAAGARLRDEVDGDIVVYGSGQVVQALLEADLVDELRLLVYPVVVGDGARLFGSTSDPRRLRLAETRTFDDGVALLVYQRAA
jgi:dihydrofolate reductase